jgi:hypothetical protein
LYLAVVELVAFRLVLLRCDRSMTGPQVAHEAKRNAACPDSFRRGNLFTLYHDTFFGRPTEVPKSRHLDCTPFHCVRSMTGPQRSVQMVSTGSTTVALQFLNLIELVSTGSTTHHSTQVFQ